MTRSLQFDVRADGDASDLTTMARQVEDLQRQLRALDRLRVEPKVRLGGADAAVRAVQQLQTRLAALPGTTRAAVQLTGVPEARTSVAALVADLRRIRDTRAKVIIDTGSARADLTAIVGRLRALRDVRIRAELDDGTFTRDIARLHQRVSALRGTKVRIDFEINPPGIRAELEGIAAALGRIRDTRVRVDADVGGASAEVRRLGDAMERLGKVGAVSLSIPGIVGLIGQVGSLGSSVVALTGVLGLVPAAGIAAGAALGTVAIGLQGLGDALGPTGTAAELEKVNAAMERLSPAGRELVTQIRALAPAWDGLRLDVQERLLAGLGAEVQQLGSAYLPTLRTGLGGVATELNAGVRMWSDWAGSAPAVNDLNTILGNTRSTLRELAPAGTNVAAALTDISVVGSAIMPELAAGATAATGRFREFIAQARETGQLEEWIRGGISTLEQLGRIAGNTGGVLGSVFKASETAGYGFLDAVEQITGELDTLLNSARGQTAMVDVFRESREAVNAALPGIRELAGATLDMLGNFARSDGLQRFAELVSQTASAISPLVAEIGNLAGDALGALSGAASLAVTAFGPLYGVLSSVYNALGPIPGTALAAVIAFKSMALLAAPLATLGTTIAGLSIATGWGAASAAVAGFGAALSGVAKALPLIAVGAILVGQAVQAASGDLDGWAAGMIAGGDAARQARADFEAHNAQFIEGSIAAGLFAKSEADLTAEINNQIAAMDPLAAAQARAQLAREAYNQAVEETGRTSGRTLAAARDLAAATDAEEAAQRRAAVATQSHTDAMRDQVAAATSALGANLDLAAATRAVVEAEDAANEAIRRHGAGSREAIEATEALTQAAMREAEAAQAVAISRAEAAGSTDSAAAGQAAYAATLLNTAATLEGPARDAVLGQIATLSDAELAALSAGAAATGFATQLLTLPDGRTVTIAVDPETGEIVSTQVLLDGMQDADVAVNVETQQALTDLAGFLGIVNTAAGTVNIDGNTQPAGTALQTVLSAIAAGQEFVTINGETVPAEQALNAIIAQVGASGAEVTIGGQNFPAAQVLRDTLGAVAAGREDVTIGGQSYPALSVLGALMGDVRNANPFMTILGRDGGVQALKTRLSTPSSSTHTIYVKQMGALSIRDTSSTYTGGGGRAMGAYATPRKIGAYATGYAYGGMRPMSAARAEIVPPRQLRIIGDRMRGDEAFIPIDRSARSLSILSLSANRMGFDLVPRSTIGPTPAMRAAARQTESSFDRMVNAGPRPPAAPQMPTLRPAMAATGGDLGALRQDIAGLRTAMEGVARGVEDARLNVNQTIVTADPVEAGRASVLGIRTGTRPRR